MRPDSERGPHRVALVVPALDEEGSIGEVVQGFRSARHPSGRPWLERVVVVDNGSRDATAARARGAGAEVVDAPERGYGHACRAGLAHLGGGRAGPPEVVVFADGDGAQVPDELGELLAPIVRGEADMVIGSRVARGEPRGMTPAQRFGNRLAVLLLRLRHGISTTDLGPFRAIRWPALELLGPLDPTYGWTIEMQIRAAQRGLRVVEVDVSNRARWAGQSKVSGTLRGVLGAGYKILRFVLAG